MYVHLDMDVSSISVYCGCWTTKVTGKFMMFFSTPQPQKITLVNYMKAVV